MLKFVELSILYDFYGSLLTNKQQKLFELYYYEDLSLGEISSQLNISRQAVYDNLKRAEKLLNQYEDKLNLVKKYNQHQYTIEKILGEINAIDDALVEPNNEVPMQLIKLKFYLGSCRKIVWRLDLFEISGEIAGNP